MLRIAVAFGFLIASGHSANPQSVDNKATASEVEAVKAKLHAQVLKVAEAEKIEPRTVSATVWREKKRATDEKMDAAVYVGHKDWAWNGGKKDFVANFDSKAHASTSSDVDAYRNGIHEKVVKARAAKTTESSAQKWKMPAGGLDAAADRKSQDWAWGGGSSALQKQDPCAGCDESGAQAYQKCAMAHGNPCAETNAAGIVGKGPGQKKDIGCCMKKEKHDRCLQCKGMDCAHGTCKVNQKYYSSRTMKK